MVDKKRFPNFKTDRNSFYEKLFKSKYAPVMYRKVKKQLSDRCVYYFDEKRERRKAILCKLRCLREIEIRAETFLHIF